MARIPCRGCRKLVNVGTKTCPYCKIMLSGQSSGKRTKVAILVALVFLLAVVVSSEDSPISEKDAEVTQMITYDESKWHPVPKDSDVRNRAGGSVYQVQWYLERTLKDPESYEGIEWSRVVTKLVDGERRYAVRHKYRARNSFGGYVIEEVYFVMGASGDVLSAVKAP